MRYTIAMSRKLGLKVAGCKPIGWVFAFVLSVTQVYPAFGACLCLDEGREIVEILTPCEEAHSCHSAAARPATPEEMDSSSSDCCRADSGWTPPLPASISRLVEIRPAFDAMAWSCSGDTGTPIPRMEGLTRGPEPGIPSFRATLYLFNASLLI